MTPVCAGWMRLDAAHSGQEVDDLEKFSLVFGDRPVQSVVQRGESKFVQLSFEPGQGLTKHRAPLALTMVVLTGQVLFTVGEDSELLKASEMLTLEPNIEHAVEAVEKSTVLLVLTPLETSGSAANASGKAAESASAPAAAKAVDHENAFDRPELIEQIAPELRSLVADHVEVCKVLQSVQRTPDVETMRIALWTIERELGSHFTAEEQVLFPRMAKHVGGTDVGPVARLLEEHAQIRRLHAEAEALMRACESHGDDGARSRLANKMIELSRALLNHLGKEDSHLFPMASRLLTDEEKAAVARELRAYQH